MTKWKTRFFQPCQIAISMKILNIKICGFEVPSVRMMFNSETMFLNISLFGLLFKFAFYILRA